MKKILDSVHGHILIEDDYIVSIIDTPEFQRLRRVEQTSIRAVYPSARHDRFIHSLGVFYVGKMIMTQLRQECTGFGVSVEDFDKLSVNYLVACLLHDVGHAPFSHTFEEFYGKKPQLAKKLASVIDNGEFKSDLEQHFDDANFHELVSAYVAVKKFSKRLSDRGIPADMDFVARMIIGCFYESRPENQVKNCFISLLHGEVIDADRLDYGCRDVWASGYSTSSIDLKRLISALHVKKNEEDEYVICFDCNVINEIDNLLSVKDFQMQYVLNHHTVVYDQWLLVRAVEYLAKGYCLEEIKKRRPEMSDEDRIYLCMNEICSLESLVGKKEVGPHCLYHPSDGDFVFMMKEDPTNAYFQEWYSRNYSRFAIWKSPDEFSHYFGIKRGTDIEKEQFKSQVKAVIKDVFGIDDVVIKKVTYKPRVKLSSLYILVHGKLRRFTEIYPKEDEGEIIVFYYVYVRKPSDSHEEIEKLREDIIEKLKPVIAELYSLLVEKKAHLN